MVNLPSVGTDIVDISRIRRLVRNRAFVERVFTEQEVAYCRDKKNAAQHYAVRFAAKEAVWKSLSQHFKNKGVAHLEISVQRLPDGRPVIQLSKRLKKFEKKVTVSLSHTDDYAVAVALFLG